ncbi:MULTISPECIES: metal-binding protein [Exiguobacterium]|uniref:Metal-binding protein n=1 Tax=Exiguobacterium profundum TaxID=307643 RepID=A0ABY8B350_9BACL|nr:MULTISPECIES: metal-binding protein [Exiguobacterium]MBQ6460602.1 metal-binding protein [Exiguobacterium sp.]WED56557.1 metal-binding protein [Exiguobacterium profundum]
MASGKTHTRTNLVATGALAVATPFLEIDVPFSLIIGAIIGTLWLSPDLDLKSDAYYRWGPLKLIWLPYVKLMPHRSLFSHLPALSDVIRIAYIGFPLVLILPFTAYEEAIRSWVDIHGMSFFLGLVFATTLHTTLDYTSTFFKKAF